MQCPDSGQIRHRGFVGVHVVAPSSISPWFRSPGAELAGKPSMTSAAASHNALPPAVDFTSSSMPQTRARTRATFPSTSGARSPNAIEAIAPAVYGPMPGTSRSSAARDGIAASGRDITACAPAFRLRARE